MIPVKPQPNRRLYIETLRAMTPGQRVRKAFELSDLTHDLLKAGVAARYPEKNEQERHEIYLGRLERCRRNAC